VSGEEQGERAVSQDVGLRLRRSSIKHLVSEDGTCSLTYKFMDTSHEGGGAVYLFEYRKGDAHAKATVTVGSWGASHAIKKAEKEGIDFWSLEFEERERYISEFLSKFGNSYEVNRFHFEEITPENGIDESEIVHKFIKLYFDLKSSKKYNDPNYVEGDGFYPDKLYFSVHYLGRKYRETYHAGEVIQHD
jgi:hypothetical protein